MVVSPVSPSLLQGQCVHATNKCPGPGPTRNVVQNSHRCGDRPSDSWGTNCKLMLSFMLLIYKNSVTYTAAHAQTCTQTQKISKSRQQHPQIRLPCYLWVIFLILLISLSPDSCSGTCPNAHSHSRPVPYVIHTAFILLLCSSHYFT